MPKINKKMRPPRQREGKANTFYKLLTPWSGVLITILTLAISLIYYLYLYGRMDFYGAPLEFINYEPKEFLLFLISSVLIISIMSPGSIFFGYMERKNEIVIRRLKSKWGHGLLTILIVTILIQMGVMYSSSPSVTKLELFIIGLWVLLWFFEEYRRSPDTEPGLLHSILFMNTGRPTIIGVVIIICLLLINSAIYGEVSAKEQVFHYIIDTTPECMAVYLRSDIALCAPFDQSKNEIDPKYSVLTLKDSPDLKIWKEFTGPIHLKPTPTQTPLPTLLPSPTRTP